MQTQQTTNDETVQPQQDKEALLREALLAVEWIGDLETGQKRCGHPKCQSPKFKGHHPDCPVKKALQA
jgi:hypothetical protein